MTTDPTLDPAASIANRAETGVTTGVDLIAAERARQIAKGYTTEHDAEHGARVLIEAAIGYARKDSGRVRWAVPADWDGLTPVERLATAGALLAAAIDALHEETP